MEYWRRAGFAMIRSDKWARAIHPQVIGHAAVIARGERYEWFVEGNDLASMVDVYLQAIGHDHG